MESNYWNYNFLRKLFPNQFRSIPSTIIWTLVYLVDTSLVFWVAYLLGFPILEAARKPVLAVYLLIAFGMFCLESFLYNLIKN